MNNIAQVQELDNKISFLKECEKLDLNVPKFKILSKDVAKDLKELHAQGMFGISNFFMKNLELQREERSDFTTIPSDDLEFEKYIQNHLRKKDLSIPYFVNEFVEGREFGANVGCIDGKIFMLQVTVVRVEHFPEFLFLAAGNGEKSANFCSMIYNKY